jgi:biopolymer transport protein ExbD
MFKKAKKKKPMNFDLNLTSMVDCLSILIIYLLMAAVFSKTDVMTTKQALGTESQSKAEAKSLWVEILNDNQVTISGQGLGDALKKQTIAIEELNQIAGQLKTANPELSTALIFPRDNSNYAVLIQTMDLLKKAKFQDVGLAPL